MSKNIDQIFIANPITSNASTDLMYFGQSPYGPGNDAAMTYANFSAQFASNVLTTKGDLYTFSTVNTRLPVGSTNGQILQAASAASTGLAWSTASYPATTTINQILYSSAANTVTGIATANNSILTTNASGVPSWSTPAQVFSWTDVTSTSQSMSVNNGYLADNAGLVTLTIPAVAAQFSIIEISGFGAGGWTIAQNAGQLIHFGNATTTTGVTGSLSSTNRYDQVKIMCVSANTTWVVSSVIGVLTVA